MSDSKQPTSVSSLANTARVEFTDRRSLLSYGAAGGHLAIHKDPRSSATLFRRFGSSDRAKSALQIVHGWTIHHLPLKHWALAHLWYTVGMADVTQILSKIESGDQRASSELLPLVYDELRKLAAARMADERAGQTLQATALVHEAYLRLVGNDDRQRWDHRGHFFAAAAEAMRRILVDRANARQAKKRGGNRKRIDFDSVEGLLEAAPSQLSAMEDAIARLAQVDAVAAQIVRLHCYAGLSVAQASESLAVSVATGYRHWSYARAWLHAELSSVDTL